MILRATLIWLAILLLAILNGGAREAFLVPRAGPQVGHVISTIILAILVLATAWLAIRWIAPATRGHALFVGVYWTALTLAFEFLAGHYMFGDSWEKLRGEYNIAQGRIWILVPIVTLFSPMWAYTVRGR